MRRAERDPIRLVMSILPSISVVIPAYNAERFIAETLESVRNQTRSPHEVIVVDDHSTDGTAAAAERGGARVISASSESNRGASAARNDGIRAATGEYLALLDADDLWLPTHLERVAGLLDAHPTAALAYSRAEKFGDDTGPSRKTIPPGIVQSAFAVAAQVNLALTCCAVFRRSVALELGGFHTELRYGEDFDFWLRLAAQHPVVCTEEITARYRIHTIGKGDTRRAAQEGQVRARFRMWEALGASGSEELREVLAATMAERWEGHLRSAWQDGDRHAFDQMLDLHHLVPRSEAIRASWARKRPWVPLRVAWNRMPGPFREAVKWMTGAGRESGADT
jgi:hypothetical protein